jgi:hypothetical protein
MGQHPQQLRDLLKLFHFDNFAYVALDNSPYVRTGPGASALRLFAFEHLRITPDQDHPYQLRRVELSGGLDQLSRKGAP